MEEPMNEERRFKTGKRVAKGYSEYRSKVRALLSRAGSCVERTGKIKDGKQKVKKDLGETI